MIVEVVEGGGAVRGEFPSIEAALPLVRIVREIERGAVALVFRGASGALLDVIAWPAP